MSEQCGHATSHGDALSEARTTRQQRRAIALDEMGEELDILIRISPDGRVFFHDIPVGMLPVALALSPLDEALAQRAHAAEAYRSSPQ